MYRFLPERADLRRLRIVVLAALLTLLLCWPNLLHPVDLVTWTAQAKLGDRDVSSEIVFVAVDEVEIDSPTEVEDFAKGLQGLHEQAAQGLYLDLHLDGLDPDVLTALVEHTSELDTVHYVVRQREDRNAHVFAVPDVLASFPEKIVFTVERADFVGFVWREPLHVNHQGATYPTLAGALSGRPSWASRPLEVDYRIDPASIPTASLRGILDRTQLPSEVEGRSFVFGLSGAASGTSVDAPASNSIPRSYISIFAAESGNSPRYVRVGDHLVDYLPFLTVCVLVLFVVLLFGQRYRKAAYGSVCVLALFVIIGPIFLPFRTGSAGGLAFLFLYGAGALVSNWRHNATLHSAETGLPNLHALEIALLGFQGRPKRALVALKIHNLAEVMSTLPPDARREYFAAVARRLRVGEIDLEVYSNGAERLVFVQHYESPQALRAHLSALLAIFRNPLRVQGISVDVPTTFGVDLDASLEPHRRIASAEALSERGSLSAKPIVFSDEKSGAEDAWRVSLQSKIDEALDKGEIFPVFQPQFELGSGKIVGYEALVRWHDAERGDISPAYFVEQCEQAGRMQKLQQFMLTSCLSAFKNASGVPQNAKLSVNVSSTLLSDTWVAELVTQVLDQCGFPADRLVLEITETARIYDHRSARAILNSLASTGVELSLDDFGTGTASLESFMRFPFAEIKVDRLFCSAAPGDPKARAIIEAALKLGSETNSRVICEGIEDQEMLDTLRNMGCRFGQGFLLGKPSRSFLTASSSKHTWLRTA